MPATVRRIIAATAKAFGITSERLCSNSREAKYAHPRAIAVMLARQLTKASFAQIGRELGGRHHSTIVTLARRGHNLTPNYNDHVLAIRLALAP